MCIKHWETVLHQVEHLYGCVSRVYPVEHCMYVRHRCVANHRHGRGVTFHAILVRDLSSALVMNAAVEDTVQSSAEVRCKADRVESVSGLAILYKGKLPPIHLNVSFNGSYVV